MIGVLLAIGVLCYGCTRIAQITIKGKTLMSQPNGNSDGGCLGLIMLCLLVYLCCASDNRRAENKVLQDKIDKLEKKIDTTKNSALEM